MKGENKEETPEQALKESITLCVIMDETEGGPHRMNCWRASNWQDLLELCYNVV
jgi:hypothetical protein